MEYGNRVISCTNEDGNSISFTEKYFTPFILASAQGIYETNNTVSTTSNTIIDGSEYQGSVMQARNIVLTVKDIDNFDVNRELIDTIFVKGSIGTLTVSDNTHRRCIQYYVESVDSEAYYDVRHTTISLLCPDPYFYDPQETKVEIQNIMPDFEFVHEFDEDGEAFGHFNLARLGTVRNISADKEIGITMIVRTMGNVTNPRITKVETQEFIQVGTQAKPLSMDYGDTLSIVTIVGKKNIYFNGVQCNQYLHEDSTFFQLTRGVNTIGYDAEEGGDFIAIKVICRYKYARA